MNPPVFARTGFGHLMPAGAIRPEQMYPDLCVRKTTACCASLGVATLIVTITLVTPFASSQSAKGPIDPCYAPLPSFSLLCFPDDPLKTVVTGEGELGYDFGPGPYARPLTRIGFSLRNDSITNRRQWLPDARVPIVSTELKGKGGVLRTTALSWGTPQKKADPHPNGIRYRRIGGDNGCLAWAEPPAGTPQELRGVAWGTNRPIQYRIAVARGERKPLALGFCESYKRTSRSRLLEIRVEGAPPETVDPMPNGIRNEPVIVFVDGSDENHDGELSVEVHPSPAGPDPNVILNAIWVFPHDSRVNAQEILSGKANRSAEMIIRCGEELEDSYRTTRMDVLRADAEQGEASPVVEIRTRRKCESDAQRGTIRFEGRMSLQTNPAFTEAREVPGGVDLYFSSGTRSAEVCVAFDETGGRRCLRQRGLSEMQPRLQSWWLDSSGVPYGRIAVPDPAIQYLLDVGVRTMYQVRDRVDGLLQFQPGPSVYRGLWVGDMGIPWITALMLGDTTAAREYLEVVARRQEADGQVRVMTPVESLIETPLLVFGVVEYALATGDAGWLKQRYPSIVSAVNWIRRARDRSMADATLPNAGLLPAGFVDGGISTPATDYGTVFWTIIGLEYAIDAARMLGREVDAREWSDLTDKFTRTLHGAIARDARPDSAGALFLPVTVGDVVKGPPQRGMASQVFPVPFGAIYERDSVLQKTVLGCLQCVSRHQEQGIPVGVGWLADGLWPSWFGAFAAIASSMYGEQERGLGLLHAIANHATAAGSWAEEQLPRRMGPGTGGDMANAQSAAAFVLAVRWGIARERSRDLELFASVTQDWLKPGATIALRENSGRFGPFSVSCSVDSSGDAAVLVVNAPDGRESGGHVRLILDAFRRAGFSLAHGEDPSPVQILPWNVATTIVLRR
jgi:hypothetical protein